MAEVVKKTEGLTKVPVTLPDDELTNGQFIDRHFSRRDMNINQMSKRLDLRIGEILEIIKELGYKLPDGT